MSIYPRKNTKGEVVGYRIEVYEAGKRLPVAYAETTKEAKRIEAQMRAGIWAKPVAAFYSTDNLWADCRNLWADEGQKDAIKSRRKFEVALGCLRTALGDTPLPEVKPAHIEAVKRLLVALPAYNGRTISRLTVPRYLAPLSKALTWAEENEKIARRPKMGKGIWKSPKRPKFALSVEDEGKQRQALQEQRGDDYVLLYDVQMAGAMRVDEMLSVTATSFRFYDTFCDLELLDTKDGGYRNIPMPLETAHRFLELVQRGLPTYRQVWRAMRFARKAAGLATTQPTHAQRHTAATRMSQRGVSIQKISEFLGHKDLKTTLGYISANTSDMREAQRILLEDRHTTTSNIGQEQ